MNKIFYNQEFLINKSEDIYYVELDGNRIQTEEELLNNLKVLFDMPDVHNWDAVYDWLGDLSWLNYESYLLIITNYSKLLGDNLASKQIFLDILKDTVEWWDGDVEKYVVGGKKKSFNVYLVD